MKRALLNIGGFTAYVGLPIVPIVYFWDFFVTKDATTTISTIAMFALVVSLSVFKYIFKGEKLPFDINMVWVFLLALCVVLPPIMEKLIYVSGAGVIGSVGGSYLFKKSAKIKEEVLEAKKNAELTAQITTALEKKVVNEII